MENKGRQSIATTASILKNYNQSLEEKYAAVKPTERKAVNPKQTKSVGEKLNQAKPAEKKPMDLRFVENRSNQLIHKTSAVASRESSISQERLQEAIIWSEIIGEPLCKRRKRR